MPDETKPEPYIEFRDVSKAFGMAQRDFAMIVSAYGMLVSQTSLQYHINLDTIVAFRGARTASR